ncbi:MAG: 16S rRNA (cytosine(1402)-N(4))-methyltransferase RsmH [Acidobacteria bacterium]|nr:16S rRNA (cytosine(1402)-N(4))-methyltransferase RsmH [Acidobacteriota bacterium]
MHIPVLVDEVRTFLAPERGGVFVDGTVGLGGHARLVLDAGATRLIGVDRDPQALAAARAALAPFGDRVTLVHADYRTLDAVLDGLGVTAVAGILLDLGVSSLQLDGDGRGFSFRRDEPLDMRMDQSQGPTLAERLATVEERELADVIFHLGEERKSRRVARAIVEARRQAPLTGTAQLAAIVRRAVGGPWQRIDPATRTFQALRIWVNDELDGLASCIGRLIARLQVPAGEVTGGRLAIISFHSLEDRTVKHVFRAEAQGDAPRVRVLTKRPVEATATETAANPRARSAKLRVVERRAAA